MFVDFLGYLMLFSAAMVIFCFNQIHALFYLISVFILFMVSLLLGYDTEFLAFLIIIVYIGAIAILFLFVVMMLDINKPSASFLTNFFTISFLLLLAVVVTIHAIHDSFDIFFNNSFNWFEHSNTEGVASSELYYSSAASLWLDNNDLFSPENGDLRELAKVLYTTYGLPFMMAAYILFIAMVGAINLTLKQKANVKRQNIYLQTTRSFEEAVKRYN